ncbi:MAG: hypothetical protein ACPGJV_09030 [Bacteriovoracaceae bacterium]
MKKLKLLIISALIGVTCFSNVSAQDDSDKSKKNIKYRKAKRLDFESILIKGQLKRPEISIVTGDVGGEDEGLLKLREDFLDHMAIDLGVEVP